MIDVAWVREHPQEAIQRWAKRSGEATAQEWVRRLLQLDERRRTLQQKVDSLRAQLNRDSRQIGILVREGKQTEASQLREKLQKLKQDLISLEEEYEQVQTAWKTFLHELPNFPDDQVPAGDSAEQNLIVEQWGDVPKPPLRKPHWEIAEELGLIHFRWGAKLAGSGFYVFAGWGARLQRALIQFFLDQAHQMGYVEISPPHLVNPETAFGTGQLPDKEGQMYHLERDNLYLIPTAEVPVTNLFRGCTLEESDLPIRMVSYTPCYRREAGSWGQMTRGLNRVHQFDKVEIVHIATPESSADELERMCEYVHTLLEKLELPHRRVLLCGGELGFAAARTYDMEVYAAGQDRWLEVSSISTFGDFQARRMNLRIRSSEKGRLRFAHTLNGSALALARLIAALLENRYSPERQAVQVPEVLRPYLDGAEWIPPDTSGKTKFPLPAWNQD